MRTAEKPVQAWTLGFDHPRYEVIEALPGAVTGALFRVHDRRLGIELALRTLPCSGMSEQAQARFQGDFLRMGRLDHPHLARVHEMGVWGGSLFYTRELTWGQSAAAALRTGDEHDLVQSIAGLADALGALHAAGLVHGLAVPEHLRVPIVEDRLGGAMVTDAALHHLIGKRYLARWRNYLPPERLRGAPPSPAGDMYGVGATLLEALGGREALSPLARGQRAPFRRSARSLDPGLVRLLDRLLDPDPERRPRNGVEVLRWLRDPGWAAPERRPSVGLLVSPLLVGREGASAALAGLLHRAGRGEVHAGEIIGAGGMGRSRLLAEVGRQAAAAGWTVLAVEAPESGRDAVLALEREVEETLGLRPRGEPDEERARAADGAGAQLAAGGAEPGEGSGADATLSAEGFGAERYARWAERLRAAVDATGARLLLLADNADRLPAGLLHALRYLVTEVEARPVLVLATGEVAPALPGAQVIPIGSLGERDLRQLLAPLLTEALNPEPLFAALHRASAGNPLWVRLLLADWLAGGRLRFPRGRPFFDERAEGSIPSSIAEAVRALVAGLKPPVRDLIEAMAVWAAPLPHELAARLVPNAAAAIAGAAPGLTPPAAPGLTVAAPEGLIVADGRGRLRFAAETFGPVVFDMLSAARREHWHAAILDALAADGAHVAPGKRAFHLLAAGRTAEAVRDFIAAARQAEAGSDHRSALEHYRLALANLGALRAAGPSRAALALAAARMAMAAGDSRLAAELLARAEPPPGPPAAERRLRFAILLARAQALRAERAVDEADSVLDQARAAARSSAEALRVDLDRTACDFLAGRWQEGEDRLRPLVARLAAEGPNHLLPLALYRLALLRRASNRRQATAIALRAAQRARRAGDHVLAAAAFILGGDGHYREGEHDRALRALDRARAEITASPHDGNLASELNTRSNVMIDTGRVDEAERLAAYACAVCQRSGNRARLGLSLQQLGRALRHLGRLEEAAEAYRKAAAAAAQGDQRQTDWRALYAVHGSLGEILCLLGEMGEAERLLRLAVADPTPGNRGLVLLTLGDLLRRRARFREALAALSKSRTELLRHLPLRAPLAVTQLVRIHLDAGDDMAAAFGLADLAGAGDSPDLEVRAEVHLVRGLVEARRGSPPYGSFDRAIAACREFGDPTRLAEILAAASGAALELEDADLTWIEQRVEELEEAASRTDARLVAAEVRGLRGDLARRLAREQAVAPPAAFRAGERERAGGGGGGEVLGEEISAFAAENRRLRAALAARVRDVELVGRSPAFTAVRAQVEAAAASAAPVLITGERGTGKSAFAVAIHELSGRRGPLIVVDAAATPSRLARLARSERPANDATVLVEEVTALDAASQEILLAWLERERAPRVIATTTADIEAEAGAGRLRGEVQRRLTARTIAVPPLRERRADLELLVMAMAAEAAGNRGLPVPEVPSEFLARCAAYPWPGNLAELRHCVATAVGMAAGGKLSATAIPEPTESAALAAIVPYRTAVRQFERRLFSEALAATGGNVPRAARLLRLPESTFRYRAGKLSLPGGSAQEEASSTDD